MTDCPLTQPFKFVKDERGSKGHSGILSLDEIETGGRGWIYCRNHSMIEVLFNDRGSVTCCSAYLFQLFQIFSDSFGIHTHITLPNP
jgi:hypothetical protein